MYQRVLCHRVAAAALACATLTAQSNPAQNPGSDLVRQGIQLDLNGQYAEARRLFARAIATAPTPQAKTAAVRAIALSYAFENDCQGAIPYEKQLYEMYLEQQDFHNAGEMANELARICLEAGAFDEAQAWYQIGHDAGLKEPGIKPDRRDLWEFRWEHAQARLAMRRGEGDPRQRHESGPGDLLSLSDGVRGVVRRGPPDGARGAA